MFGSTAYRPSNCRAIRSHFAPWPPSSIPANRLERQEHPMRLETVKKFAERLTGWAKPSMGEAAGLVSERKPRTLRFRDDGVIPNHPVWPLILYRGAVRLPGEFDAAAIMEVLFES